jgi:hypothetical protein
MSSPPQPRARETDLGRHFDQTSLENRQSGKDLAYGKRIMSLLALALLLSILSDLQLLREEALWPLFGCSLRRYKNRI